MLLYWICISLLLYLPCNEAAYGFQSRRKPLLSILEDGGSGFSRLWGGKRGADPVFIPGSFDQSQIDPGILSGRNGFSVDPGFFQNGQNPEEIDPGFVRPNRGMGYENANFGGRPWGTLEKRGGFDRDPGFVKDVWNPDQFDPGFVRPVGNGNWQGRDPIRLGGDGSWGLRGRSSDVAGLDENDEVDMEETSNVGLQQTLHADAYQEGIGTGIAGNPLGETDLSHLATIGLPKKRFIDWVTRNNPFTRFRTVKHISGGSEYPYIFPELGSPSENEKYEDALEKKMSANEENENGTTNGESDSKVSVIENNGNNKGETTGKKESQNEKADIVNKEKNVESTSSGGKNETDGGMEIVDGKKEPKGEKKVADAEKKEPEIEKKEAVSENNEVVSENKEPEIEKKEAVNEKKEPEIETKEVVSEKKESEIETKEVVSEKKEPEGEKKESDV